MVVPAPWPMWLEDLEDRKFVDIRLDPTICSYQWSEAILSTLLGQ